MIIIVAFVATGVVSAAANVTDDAVGIEETGNEIVSVDETNIDYSKINESNSDFMNYNLSVLSTNDNSQTLGIKETHFDDFRYGDRFSSLLNVPLRDANNNLIYNEKVTYSFDNITAPVEYLSHQSITMPKDLQMNAYHFITLKYEGSSTYAPCEKTIAFKYVSGRFGTIFNQIPTKLELDFVNFNVYPGSINIYLKDDLGKVYSNLLFNYVFDDNGTVFQQYSKTNGNNIKLNFSPLTQHKITINFKGNNLFKSCTLSRSFSIGTSIGFSQYDGEFVEGGKNIPYYLYYKDGMEVKTIFAPFGISTVNITNEATGQSRVTKINILKQELDVYPLFVDYDDEVEYKVRVIENDKYAVNKKVIFTIGDNSYNATTDDNGYATLKIHLKAGIYTVTVKYENIIKSNKIYVNPVYVGNKCRNVYISTVNEYYNQNMKINYGWEGNLDGYFKIFKGNSLIYNKRINTGSNVSDYFEYSKHDYNYANNQLSVGSYTVKLVADDGTILKTSSFKIIKTPTELSIGSKKAKSGKKITISSYVSDDIMGGCVKTANGQVTLTINGKTYSAKVKNGKFSISFKAPSKAKKYTSKLIYSGDSNYKGSSKTFKIIVKKGSSVKKTTTKKTTNSNVKKITLKFTNSRSSGKYVKNTYVYVGYGDIYGQYVRTDTHNGVKGITFIKANVYFKNNRNGKTIVKTKKLDKWGYSKTKLISGYTPNKVIIFYK
ncbi:Ig-like domain-containing protein [uncultured Methanobrevibacter sp.]|uniref:Ig-like domain-containing protein n=1 Tax=uncultured Methanobrevibacter sp. TaxID=253161 RepID=UPI0025DA7F23|nr:Ig-like domain-containing protein [uncultured Methanobrevibacter sp.]